MSAPATTAAPADTTPAVEPTTAPEAPKTETAPEVPKVTPENLASGSAAAEGAEAKPAEGEAAAAGEQKAEDKKDEKKPGLLKQLASFLKKSPKEKKKALASSGTEEQPAEGAAAPAEGEAPKTEDAPKETPAAAEPLAASTSAAPAPEAAAAPAAEEAKPAEEAPRAEEQAHEDGHKDEKAKSIVGKAFRRLSTRFSTPKKEKKSEAVSPTTPEENTAAPQAEGATDAPAKVADEPPKLEQPAIDATPVTAEASASKKDETAAPAVAAAA